MKKEIKIDLFYYLAFEYLSVLRERCFDLINNDSILNNAIELAYDRIVSIIEKDLHGDILSQYVLTICED